MSELTKNEYLSMLHNSMRRTALIYGSFEEEHNLDNISGLDQSVLLEIKNNLDILNIGFDKIYKYHRERLHTSFENVI